MAGARDVIHHEFSRNFPLPEIFMNNLPLSSLLSKLFIMLSTTYLTFGHFMAGYQNFMTIFLLCYWRMRIFKNKKQQQQPKQTKPK